MMVEKISVNARCPRCSKNALVTDVETTELFCGMCGFVISERLEDSGPEWRSFIDDKTNKARTGDGTSLTRHDQGLATIIDPVNRDSTGKLLSNSMKTTIKRLRVWDSRSQVSTSTQRNFRQAFSELGIVKDKLALPDAVVEKAAYIYRKATEKKLVRGRSISTLIVATLYTACRDMGIPRTLKDFADTANIKRRNLAVCYRMLVKELDLKMPVVNSIQCIARIASVVGISEKSKRYAIRILKKAQQNEILSGKDPMGLAASSLYIAGVRMRESYTQKEIAMAAGVTEVTVRNRCKALKSLDV